MTDVRFCKVQFEEPPLAPERRPRERPSARDDQIPHVEGVSGPPGAAWGPQARGGGSAAGTVEDSVGQQATLTSCQPGSDTPGSPVGLWAGDRPPSAQIRTIIPPQVHRPGHSGDQPLRQAGSRLLVNPDIIHVERGRRRQRTIGITGPTSTDIEVEHDIHRSSRDARRPTARLDFLVDQARGTSQEFPDEMRRSPSTSLPSPAHRQRQEGAAGHDYSPVGKCSTYRFPPGAERDPHRKQQLVRPC